MKSSAWEKQDHGPCRPGHHVPYRVKSYRGRELRCKLCYEIRIEGESAAPAS